MSECPTCGDPGLETHDRVVCCFNLSARLDAAYRRIEELQLGLAFYRKERDERIAAGPPPTPEALAEAIVRAADKCQSYDDVAAACETLWRLTKCHDRYPTTAELRSAVADLAEIIRDAIKGAGTP